MKNLAAFILLQVFGLFNVTSQAQWIQTSGAIDTNVTQLVVLNSYLCAATTTGYNNGQIIASTDNGASWYTAKTGLARVIDAFAASGSNLFLSLDDAGVYISTDYCKTWTQTNTNVEPYAFSFVTLGSKLFVGTWYQGVYATSDNGANWTQLDSGLTNLMVNVLWARDPYLYAGTSGGGMFLSTNSGISWKAISTGIPAYYGYMHGMASIGSNLFVGTYNKGVYLSTNNGANWTAVNSGLPSANQTTALISSGNNLFESSGAGVYLTSNFGTSWTNVNQGLTHLGINALVIKDGYLFAGSDSGVWRRPLSEMITGVNDKSNDLPINFSLEQNYPNPFNPSTVIKYSLSSESNVNIRFYNSLGQIVREVNEGNRRPGNYEISFNSSSLASGIYFYSIKAVSTNGKNDFSAVKKMILLK